MEAPSDSTQMGMLIACGVYIVKAMVDGYVSLASRINGNGNGKTIRGELNEVHTKDVQHLQYQIDELKKETDYSRRWRHWMANQMQKLMLKAGLECDQLPTE